MPESAIPRTARSAVMSLLRRLHFYIGLFIAPFIFMAALTGTLYVMTPQLENALYHHQLFTSSTGADQPLSKQVIRAREYIGRDARIAAVRPAPNAGETTRVMFQRNDLGPSETQAVFIDPKTLDVRGTLTVYGTSGVLPLRTWLDYLHRSLLLGDIGRSYSELAASWLWIAALGGGLLWAVNRKPRGISNPNRVKKSDALRRWHTTLGIILLLGLVFFSATGLTWSRWAGDNISRMRVHFGWTTPGVNTALRPPAERITPQADEHAGHYDSGVMPPSAGPATIHAEQFDRVVTIARTAGIDAAKLEIRPARTTDKAWTVSEIDRGWPTQVDSVAIDPQSDAVVDKVAFVDYGLLAKLTRWGVDAHMGVLFGLANQLLLVAFGLGLCLMIVIGYRLWWQRRPAGGEISPADTLRGCWRQLSTGSRFLLLVVTVVVAVSLPVMGVSLLLLLAVDGWRWRRSRADSRS